MRSPLIDKSACCPSLSVPLRRCLSPLQNVYKHLQELNQHKWRWIADIYGHICIDYPGFDFRGSSSRSWHRRMCSSFILLESIYKPIICTFTLHEMRPNTNATCFACTVKFKRGLIPRSPLADVVTKSSLWKYCGTGPQMRPFWLGHRAGHNAIKPRSQVFLQRCMAVFLAWTRCSVCGH